MFSTQALGTTKQCSAVQQLSLSPQDSRIHQILRMLTADDHRMHKRLCKSKHHRPQQRWHKPLIRSSAVINFDKKLARLAYATVNLGSAIMPGIGNVHRTYWSCDVTARVLSIISPKLLEGCPNLCPKLSKSIFDLFISQKPSAKLAAVHKYYLLKQETLKCHDLGVIKYRPLSKACIGPIKPYLLVASWSCQHVMAATMLTTHATKIVPVDHLI